MSGWGDGADLPVTGFRRRGGDGWQAALSHPVSPLRAALYVRACVKALYKQADTRIAVATGDGTLPANGDTNAAHGEAFTQSGRLLDDMKGSARLAFSVQGAPHAAFVLADHIATGWTPAQARAMALMLVPKAGTRAKAAEHLGISRQAVDQALRAAGFSAFDAALRAIDGAADNTSQSAAP
jgi:DNA-binding phage protein